jgi:zinc protease
VNKVRTTKVFSEQGILNKAMGLCLHELLGDAANINQEIQQYEAINASDILQAAKKILRKENCSTLHVIAKK